MGCKDIHTFENHYHFPVENASDSQQGVDSTVIARLARAIHMDHTHKACDDEKLVEAGLQPSESAMLSELSWI